MEISKNLEDKDLTHVYIKETGQILTFTPGYFYIKKAVMGKDAIIEMLKDGFIGKNPLFGEEND